MAIVSMSVSSIDKLGLWDKVCEYKGWNPYIRNEKRILESEIVDFDDEFKKEPEKYKYYVTRTDQHHDFRIKSDYTLKEGDCFEIDDNLFRIDFIDEDEVLMVVPTKFYRVYQV